MSTEDRTPGPSGTGRARTGGDSPGMTEAEKRMAEWEARHDVAARGHHAPPDALQHYFAHERLVHDHPTGEHGPHPVEPARTDAAKVPQSTPPATSPATSPAEGRSRGLLSRLFRRH